MKIEKPFIVCCLEYQLDSEGELQTIEHFDSDRYSTAQEASEAIKEWAIDEMPNIDPQYPFHLDLIPTMEYEACISNCLGDKIKTFHILEMICKPSLTQGS